MSDRAGPPASVTHSVQAGVAVVHAGAEGGVRVWPDAAADTSSPSKSQEAMKAKFKNVGGGMGSC